MNYNIHTKKLCFIICSLLFVFSINGFSQISQPNFIENFTAEKLNNKVKLKWSVDIELNIESYIIENSADGVDFIQIIYQNSHGNSGSKATYVKFDNTPLEGVSFYRINSYDYNGGTAFSKTIAFENEQTKENLPVFSMYPNPYNIHNLTIEFVALHSGNAQIIITDLNGKTIHQSTIESDIISLNLDLSQGMYLVSVLTNSDRHIKKLIVD